MRWWRWVERRHFCADTASAGTAGPIAPFGRVAIVRPRMSRRLLRLLNVVVGLAAMASALAALGSHLFEAGYAERHADSLVFVGVYVAFQAVIVVAFARDTWLVPWLALAKALAAYVFLATLDQVGHLWMLWTPGRYVYAFFDWRPDAPLVLIAFSFLGRGVWNTLNALYFTADWWRPLRISRPLLGRAVTAVPIAVVVFCAWRFVELARFDARSRDAREVAQLVLDGVDCEAVRTHAGETTVDTRQRADKRYQVRISYGCERTQVLVAAEGGGFAAVGGARRECCQTGS